MTAVKTWEQHEFKTPNCQLYRDEGDYYSLDHFVPTRDLQQLQRFPTWADTLTYPANWEHT
ncbi:MAG: hypothetical protein U9R72_10520, partial [Chloroflexota bacterium]|nr:hypothetical protein [Chloroflexota bacterium]